MVLGSSQVTITWQVPEDIKAGEYRIRHNGYYRYILGGIFPYYGVSNHFQVNWKNNWYWKISSSNCFSKNGKTCFDLNYNTKPFVPFPGDILIFFILVSLDSFFEIWSLFIFLINFHEKRKF